MKFRDLASWLRWQEALHPRQIELGLGRLRPVAARLTPLPGQVTVYTVAGTNGKGSTVAVLEAVLEAAGRRVGSYTSPHLVRYNERVRLGGAPVDDDRLMQAFQTVEDARGDARLTYFEFGTLAALELFASETLDDVILEVGMGGRLDAVNLVDADVAIITTIGLDHQAWLGHDREAIGFEKAGVLRAGRPVVLGDRDPPRSVLDQAARLAAPVSRLDVDFQARRCAEQWDFLSRTTNLTGLPVGRLAGPLLDNAACALRAVDRAQPELLDPPDVVRAALRSLTLPGRLQVVPGPVEWVLDLAHNPDGAAALGEFLDTRPPVRRRVAIFGMLADKDLEGVVRRMRRHVDDWLIVGLGSVRGTSSDVTMDRIRAAGVERARDAGDVVTACRIAAEMTVPGDRIIAFGSFQLVGPVLQQLGLYSTPTGGLRPVEPA
jgi:dihydrofolate synthase/folylpolyglutamate synthase